MKAYQKREAQARIQCWQNEIEYLNWWVSQVQFMLENLTYRIELVKSNIERERESVKEETE